MTEGFKRSSMFLILGIATIMICSLMTIELADAKKGKGVYNQKYGSATSHIVCGDKLCSEISEDMPILNLLKRPGDKYTPPTHYSGKGTPTNPGNHNPPPPPHNTGKPPINPQNNLSKMLQNLDYNQCAFANADGHYQKMLKKCDGDDTCYSEVDGTGSSLKYGWHAGLGWGSYTASMLDSIDCAAWHHDNGEWTMKDGSKIKLANGFGEKDFYANNCLIKAFSAKLPPPPTDHPKSAHAYVVVEAGIKEIPCM